MKKRNKNKYKVVKADADLDRDLDGYDVESSDDGLDTEDRILIDNARGRKRKVEEEEVLPVHQSSSSDEESFADGDEGEEDEDGIEEGADAISEDEGEGKSSDDELYGGGVSSEMDSDLEDKNEEDGLPDSKAWGSKRKNYYNTDYVDKDYLGFDDEEAALTEEQEAKAIQQRLLTQIEGADFTMGLLDKVEEKKEEALTKNVKLEIEKKIVVDRSKLSEDQLKEFDERETPGFNKLLQDVKYYEEYSKLVLAPLINLYEKSNQKDLDGIKFLKFKYFTIWRFSLNFVFLLHLKARRISNLDRHPIMKRLNEINTLLKKLDSFEMKTNLRESMLRILVALSKNMNVELSKQVDQTIDIKGKTRKERRKMLQLLAKRKEMEEDAHNNKENIKKIKFADELGMSLEESAKMAEEGDDGDEMEESEEDDNETDIGKRPATYQIIKNKGLTPKRKKEMRNPRVRNKNKYKKAIVRRKGQVKVARKEVQKYDGEISGIKKNLSRSIKLK
ncbi:hypothetical protein O3M35_002217 [Rhynocoris fuscipes]|uniref:Sas10 C-terminal domain-containing protein n=1 Tax=Rhynocoris fuscipes TaxID=488301 RepID=A0AAW1CSW8_9HEMI